MLPCLPRFARFFILVCIMNMARCVEAPPALPQQQLPGGVDFVLTKARFEERRDGRTLWRGRGEQAQGDVGHLAVQSLELEHLAESPNATGWTLHAPDADMNFQQGTGRFAPLELIDVQGHIIHAQSGHYHEKEGTMDVTAPLSLTSPGLEAHASAAHIDLRANRVDVSGPVTGTFLYTPVEL